MWLLFLIIVLSLSDLTNSENCLRVSLEFLNLSRTNNFYGEVSAEMVPYSKLTNKAKGSVRFYYEPNDKLMIKSTLYKLSKNDKEYVFFRATRSLKAVMLIADCPLGHEARALITPDISWPPQANVTYTIRDFWPSKSKVPMDIIPLLNIPKGRYKLVAIPQYPNNTILTIITAIVNIFQSAEDFD